MSTQSTNDWILQEIAPVEPGIVCHDIERMIGFYTKILGLQLINDANTTPEVSSRFGAAPDGYRIVRMQTERGQKIKLVQPKFESTRQESQQWVFQRCGIAYLTFVVADVDDVVSRLRSRGVQFVSPTIVEVRRGIFAIFILDPENNYLEFIELRDKPKS